MTRFQYLLTKLAEEASEVSQIALKTQQFGPDEVYPIQTLTNFQRMHQELRDMLSIVIMLNEEYDFGFSMTDKGTRDAVNAKKEKVNKYYDYSRTLGMVENEDLRNDQATN